MPTGHILNHLAWVSRLVGLASAPDALKPTDLLALANSVVRLGRISSTASYLDQIVDEFYITSLVRESPHASDIRTTQERSFFRIAKKAG